MKKPNPMNRAVMVMAAERYAKANPADPFAFKRCMTHINNGIATYADKDGRQGYYDAEEDSETRELPDGTRYEAMVYKNLVRV